jgi:FkbM family methyltransferase
MPSQCRQKLSILKQHCKLRISARNPLLFVDQFDNLGKQKSRYGYYSQRGQDFYVYERIFKRKNHGIFVDIGANHPTFISNTYFLELRGWTGLAFEPQEHVRKLWKDCRKTPCLPYVIGEQNGTIEFTEVLTEGWQHALAGVTSYMKADDHNLTNITIHKVIYEQKTLKSIFEEYGLYKIDLLSIDVEGYEENVLKGIDFNSVNIFCFVIENDRSFIGNEKLRKYLFERGYKQVARLSGDDIFVFRGA